jgi:SSS family solute:Na+ symporter
MFGPKSEKLSALFNILNLVPVVYTISLGLLIQMLTGIELTYSIVLGVSFVTLYSIFGGFRAVVYSDIFQFFVMITAVFLVVFFSIYKFGITPLNNLPKSYFHPMGTFSFGEVLAWGLIALSTLVDPNFYQRCFAAKNFTIAKKGILLSTVVWICFDLCLTVGAMYARSILPDAPPENGYFYYALQLLPNGLRGLFLAGICATVLSTLDSYIFLAGTTLSFDLVSKRLKQKVIFHYLGILVVAVTSILLALSFEGNIKSVWKTLGSISSAALLIPVIFGHLFKNQLSDNGFILSAILGAAGTIYWRLSGLKYTHALDEIYIGMFLSLMGVLFSLKFLKRTTL